MKVVFPDGTAVAGVPAAEAVEWVRENYDDRAVETSEQEAFVRAF